MSAASAAPSTTRASCSTSAAIASSRSRRRSSISGTRSCPTTSSSGRACRASIYRGKFYAYPLKAFEALRNLGLVRERALHGLLRLGQGLPGQRAHDLPPMGAQPVRRAAVRIFFKTYTEKVWGMGCDEISADWAAQRIKGLNLGARVIDGAAPLARPAQERRRGRQDADRMLPLSAPRPGHDVGGLRRQDQAHGRPGPDGPQVTGLRYDAASKLWTVAAIGRRRRGARLIRRVHVLSSAPMRELMNAIEPRAAQPVPGARPEIPRLPHRRADRPTQQELPDNWVYIHDPSVKVGRVQNFRSWSPEMIPDGVSTCLGLEYFCFEGDGLWTRPTTS